MLRAARRPVLMAGRVSRDAAGWARRVALAEATGARVVTDLKLGAAFPIGHALHAGAPSMTLSPEGVAALRDADLVLALDWLDPGATLRRAGSSATVLNASLDHLLHNGFGGELMGLAPQDLHLACSPEPAVRAIADAMGVGPGTPPAGAGPFCAEDARVDVPLDVATMTRVVDAGLRDEPVENRWIGQRIAGPDIGIAAMARAQGAVGLGPVATAGELPPRCGTAPRASAPVWW